MNKEEIGNIIKDFIEAKAKELNRDVQDIAIGLDTFAKCIDVYLVEPNGYDGMDVNCIDHSTKYK